MQDADVLGYARATIRALAAPSLLEVNDATVMDEIPDWTVNLYVKLIVAIEQRFGIRLQSDAYMGFETVGDLVKGVKALLREPGQSERPHG